MTEDPHHRAWRVTEPIHAMVYFVPEASRRYAELGVEPGDAYFASRGAAHAGLAWPDPPHLVLWHAQMLLREFRGDGHVAALLAAGLSGLESIVLHAASGELDREFLRSTRGRSRTEWAAAADRLRSRGLIDGDEISERGRALRADLEKTTDRLAAPAYDVIGINGCVRLAELTRPISRTIVKAGMLNPAGAPHRS